MRPRCTPHPLFAALAVVSGLAATTAGAVTVDGVLDAQYGTAVSTQTTQTGMGDNRDFGSELDEAFAHVDGGTLFLLFTGHFNRWHSEFIIEPNQLVVFIDVAAGGQHTLSAANPHVGMGVTLQALSGLTFDDDFAPDYWLIAGRIEGNAARELSAYYAELPDGGGGAGYFLGYAVAGPPGTLSGPGSFNPHGIRASIDLSPVAGVTAGCGPSSGTGVTTGIEWAIPLAAIGNPSGPIRVCALIGISRTGMLISNQVLGPIPSGICDLGPPSGVDFGDVAGPQYFEIGGNTPAGSSSWGRLKAIYR